MRYHVVQSNHSSKPDQLTTNHVKVKLNVNKVLAYSLSPQCYLLPDQLDKDLPAFCWSLTVQHAEEMFI